MPALPGGACGRCTGCHPLRLRDPFICIKSLSWSCATLPSRGEARGEAVVLSTCTRASQPEFLPGLIQDDLEGRGDRFLPDSRRYHASVIRSSPTSEGPNFQAELISRVWDWQTAGQPKSRFLVDLGCVLNGARTSAGAGASPSGLGQCPLPTSLTFLFIKYLCSLKVRR